MASRSTTPFTRQFSSLTLTLASSAKKNLDVDQVESELDSSPSDIQALTSPPIAVDISPSPLPLVSSVPSPQQVPTPTSIGSSRTSFSPSSAGAFKRKLDDQQQQRTRSSSSTPKKVKVHLTYSSTSFAGKSMQSPSDDSACYFQPIADNPGKPSASLSGSASGSTSTCKSFDDATTTCSTSSSAGRISNVVGMLNESFDDVYDQSLVLEEMQKRKEEEMYGVTGMSLSSPILTSHHPSPALPINVTGTSPNCFVASPFPDAVVRSTSSGHSVLYVDHRRANWQNVVTLRDGGLPQEAIPCFSNLTHQSHADQDRSNAARR
jgi:hypothetical protein